MAKIQAYAKQQPEAELLLLKTIHILHSCYHPIIGHIILKDNKCLYSRDYTIDHHDNEEENEKKITDTT